MSFNQIIFNRSSFDHSSSEGAIYLDLEGFEKADAFVGVSTEVKLFCIPFERVGIEIRPTHFRKINTVTGNEALGYNVALESTFWLDIETKERISVNHFISRIINISASDSETFLTYIKASKQKSFSVSYNEKVGSEAEIYCVYNIHDAFANELISQTASTSNYEEIACLLDITLLPGEHLIVDAENYNVFLNGVNMIHTQKGRWLDELSRDTVSITITAAEGGKGLTADILYRERWL